MLTAWKAEPETAWLYEVSNVALQQGLQHLQQAYVNFWGKRAKYPTFKSKHKSTGVGDVLHVGIPVPERRVMAGEDGRGRWTFAGRARCPRVRSRPRSR